VGSISLNNKKELEKLFADDFSSPVFPVLAEMYLKENDLRRASLVCNIGLENAPHNVNGQYVQALVLIKEKNYSSAKKILKNITALHPLHLNSLIQLFQIAHNENNSLSYLYRLAKKIILIDSGYQPAINIINDYKQTKQPKNVSKKTLSQKVTIEAPFDINKNIASLTLASILKSQGHYNQALDVLALLDGADDKVKKEIKQIKKMISEQK
tara:strand:- start:4027 stop:4662 length:636 start_codon:yes stop_codon:yes gene_type:complete